MRRDFGVWCGMMVWLAAGSLSVLGQAVVVTLRLDTNRIDIGGSTTLHVYGQVAPALRQDADRIFAWYVDVLNGNGSTAAADYGALLKPASDNDPLLSSTGSTQGANRVGIYDTFLGLAGAGVDAPVELIRIPVRGLAAGRAHFQVRAGTSVDGLSGDFLVAPRNDGAGWTGGDYTAAGADLDVGGGSCAPRLTITPLDAAAGAGPGRRLLLSFTPCSGEDSFVEALSSLGGTNWQVLPGAPHNSGSLTVTNTGGARLFRVRTRPAGTGNPGDMRLAITPAGGTPGLDQRFTLNYQVVPGFDYRLEFTDTPGTGVWQAVPGGPQNSGSVTISHTGPRRLYRLRADAQ